MLKKRLGMTDIVFGNNSDVGDNFSHGTDIKIGNNDVVGNGVTFGCGITVGNNVVINDGAIVSDGTTIGNNVVVTAGASVSANTTIANNSVFHSKTQNVTLCQGAPPAIPESASYSPTLMLAVAFAGALVAIGAGVSRLVNTDKKSSLQDNTSPERLSGKFERASCQSCGAPLSVTSTTKDVKCGHCQTPHINMPA
jgi:LSD1 subclass zinc finger protein